ncbi:MAG: hypothetical protein CMN76_10435 [Spirochaetaceae bacterium]|nr:hypothetical protein [Spirochaetaceae bacterium]|tara:strand:+ start:53234 stop:54895 length:1662 start_codon:yes stop_codon:yes gene_type:complete
MAKHFFLSITLLLAGTCTGLQPMQPSGARLSLPEIKSYPLPDRPVSSLQELEKEPVTLAYSLEFDGLDSPDLQRIVEQRIHGWLRNVPVRGSALPTFRIGPEDNPPEGYPYTLRVKIQAKENQEYSLSATLQHSRSGRSYSAFQRNFTIEDPESDGLALYSGLSIFLTDGTEPLISFPASTGDDLRQWVALLGTGQVKLISGQDASVEIRNRTGALVKSGQTPMDVDLPSGAYEFTIKRKGMEPRIRTLIIRPAAQEVVLMSWPDDESASSLSVFTSPSRLQVALEGTVQGQTPLAFPSLMAGEVHLEIARKEEDTGEAFVLRKSTVSMGEGEEITRYFPFDYYIDFQRAAQPGNLWDSNRSLRAIRKEGDQLKLEPVRQEDGLAPGLLTRPIEAMDQKIQISFLPGAALDLGIVSGQGSDRPYLKLETGRLLFTAPGSEDTSVYERPESETDRLDILTLEYEEEESNLSIYFNGARLYDGPFQNNGFFQIYLAGPGSVLPVQEMQVRAGPVLGNAVVEWGRSLIFDLGRSAGLYKRIRPVPEQSDETEQESP